MAVLAKRYTIRKNGVNAGPIIEVDTGLTGAFEDDVNTANFTPTDEINYRGGDTGGTSGTIKLSYFACMMTNTDPEGQPLMRRRGGVPGLVPGDQRIGRGW